MENKESIGTRIKQARIEALGYRKMTQKELSEKIGCTRDTVRNWEHDRVIPDNDRLKQIALICNVDWRWLLLGDIVNSTNDEGIKNILVQTDGILKAFTPEEEEKIFQQALFRAFNSWGIGYHVEKIEDKEELCLFLKRLIIKGIDLYAYIKQLEKRKEDPQ